MKFREPHPPRPVGLKSAELMGHPEEDRRLQFDIHDFFTAEEWSGLIETLTKFDYDEDEVTEFEARNFLDGALALRFLDQKKFEELKSSTVAKRMMKGYLRDTDEEVRPQNWQSLNAIAVWLWPEFEQVDEVRDQVTKFRRSAEKKTKRKTPDYLHAAEMAVLYPDLKEQLGITEQWLKELNNSVDVVGGPDYLSNRARFALTKHLFFPPELFDEDPSGIKKWVRESLDYQRKNNLFVESLGDNLLTVAFVRLVLKQDVIYSNAGIQITDQKSLRQRPELPQRPQV